MRNTTDVETWAVQRAQEILMREGMDLAVSALDRNSVAVRAKGKLLAMAIATSLLEASSARAETSLSA
jgi:hypothetical protein